MAANTKLTVQLKASTYIQGRIQDYFGGGGVQKDFFGGGTKNNKKRIKNLFIFIFIKFLRVGKTFTGEGVKTPSPPGYGLAYISKKILKA